MDIQSSKNNNSNFRALLRAAVLSRETMFNLIKETLYPSFCVGCGKCGSILCMNCFEKIERSITGMCFHCGRISKNSRICRDCRRKNKFVSAIIWSSSYKDEVVRELVHEFKYGGVYEAGDILAEILSQRLFGVSFSKELLLVVPVPLHKNKLRKRGFNQAEYLARSISKSHNLHGGLFLTRKRETQTQVKLSKSERSKNLAGSIVCNEPKVVLGRDILLLDDVATTGATLNECARALKEAGAKKIYAAVVARG